MNYDIFYGNINECTYAGMAGNMFGVPHYKVVEENVFLIKFGANSFVRLDDFISKKKNAKIYKRYATKLGEHYIGSMVSLNEIIEERMNEQKGNVKTKKLK